MAGPWAQATYAGISTGAHWWQPARCAQVIETEDSRQGDRTTTPIPPGTSQTPAAWQLCKWAMTPLNPSVTLRHACPRRWSRPSLSDAIATEAKSASFVQAYLGDVH